MTQKSGFPGGMVFGFAVAAAIALAILSTISFFSPTETEDVVQEAASSASEVTVDEDAEELTQEGIGDVPEDTGPVPEISTFLLNPDGQMLLAGRAPVGWDVSVLLDGEPLAVVTSDGGGEFAEFFELDASEDTRVLSLAMTSRETGEIVLSRDEVIITELADAEITEKTDGGVSAKTVLLADETGVQVLQAPAENAPEVMSIVRA